MKKIVFLLAILAGLNACNNYGDDSLTVVNNGSETEYIVHMKKIKDSIQLNLSDLAKDFNFVALETKPECIFSNGEIYMSNEYILVMKPQHGILQFGKNGKFIRTLVNVGEGPEEYTRALWTVNEEEQILLLSDSPKENYFLQFDLNSGEYLGNLPKSIIGKTKDILYENEKIWVVPWGKRNSGQESFFIYQQNLVGQLIQGIKAPVDYYTFRTDRSLHKSPSGMLFHIPQDDTVYTIKKGQMEPYVIFDYGEKNPPSRSVGNNTMNIENDIGSFIYLSSFKIINMETTGNVAYTTGLSTSYVLDKKHGKTHFCGEMFLDPTHAMIDCGHFQYRSFKSNGLIYYLYHAVDLLEHSQEALADLKFKEPYRSQLEKIVKNLNENDNPVLLIGKIL